MTKMFTPESRTLLDTPLCRLLDIRFPIVQGGMTLVGTGRLAAAVSNGGGLGVVSAGRLTLAELERELDLALDSTGEPLGINIPIGRDQEWLRAAFAAAFSRPLKVVFMGGGNPKPWCAPVKDAGKLLGIVVATPQQAEKSEAIGADVVIAESSEAGGRTSKEPLAGMALIPACAQRVAVPLVAAGSLVDGRGLAAALCLGADGVQMGTRFMLSEESPLHVKTREAMIASEITDTVILGSRHQLGRRVLRGAASEDVLQQEQKADMTEMIALLSGERSRQGLHGGDLENGLVACGQGVGLIGEVLTVAEIIESTVRQAEDCLTKAAQMLRRST